MKSSCRHMPCGWKRTRIRSTWGLRCRGREGFKPTTEGSGSGLIDIIDTSEYTVDSAFKIQILYKKKVDLIGGLALYPGY